MADASFTLDGSAGPLTTTHGATVALALVTRTGVRTVNWELFGYYTNQSVTEPSITSSGTPSGVTASITLPSVSDGYGASYGIRCTVTDNNGDTASSTAGIYVLNDSGLAPGFPNETTEFGANGWADRMNQLLNGSGSGGGSASTLSEVLTNGSDAGGKNIFGVGNDDGDPVYEKELQANSYYAFNVPNTGTIAHYITQGITEGIERTTWRVAVTASATNTWALDWYSVVDWQAASTGVLRYSQALIPIADVEGSPPTVTFEVQIISNTIHCIMTNSSGASLWVRVGAQTETELAPVYSLL